MRNIRTNTETFIYYGIEFDVEFNFIPEEPAVLYYRDGSGYPGSGAEFEICAISHKGDDMTDLLESHIDDMETEFLQQYLDRL